MYDKDATANQSCPNVAIYTGLLEYLNISDDDPDFTLLVFEDQLDVRNDGDVSVASYDKSTFRSATKSHGVHVASINLFWVAMFYTPIPGVPILRSSISKCVTKYVPGDQPPTTCPFMVTIGVHHGDKSPCLQKGFLKRLSPGEVVYALVFKIADACKGGIWDEATKTAWRRLILTVPAEFVRLDQQADYRWKAKGDKGADWCRLRSALSVHDSKKHRLGHFQGGA